VLRVHRFLILPPHAVADEVTVRVPVWLLAICGALLAAAGIWLLVRHFGRREWPEDRQRAWWLAWAAGVTVSALGVLVAGLEDRPLESWQIVSVLALSWGAVGCSLLAFSPRIVAGGDSRPAEHSSGVDAPSQSSTLRQLLGQQYQVTFVALAVTNVSCVAVALWGPSQSATTAAGTLFGVVVVTVLTIAAANLRAEAGRAHERDLKRRELHGERELKELEVTEERARELRSAVAATVVALSGIREGIRLAAPRGSTRADKRTDGAVMLAYREFIDTSQAVRVLLPANSEIVRALDLATVVIGEWRRQGRDDPRKGVRDDDATQTTRDAYELLGDVWDTATLRAERAARRAGNRSSSRGPAASLRPSPWSGPRWRPTPTSRGLADWVWDTAAGIVLKDLRETIVRETVAEFGVDARDPRPGDVDPSATGRAQAETDAPTEGAPVHQVRPAPVGSAPGSARS
jgi:hypothetical protein